MQESGEKFGLDMMMPYPVVLHRRAFQRSLGIHVLPSGVVKVTSGKTTSKKVISEFLLHCEDWIYRNLDAYNELREMYPPKKYVEGEKFLFQGEERTLTLSLTTNKRPSFEICGSQLVLFLSLFRSQIFTSFRRH